MEKRFTIALVIILMAILIHTEKTKNIPQYGKVFYQMGIECANECTPEKRLRYFQESVRHNPKASNAHYHLGLAYEALGGSDDSLRSFIKAGKLDQKNSHAFFEAGQNYFERGDYDRALRYFLQADARRDRPHEVYYYLARIYDQKGQYELAIEHYNNIVSVRPEYADKVCPRWAELYYLLDDEEGLRFRARMYRQHGRGRLADQLEQSYSAIKDSHVQKD